MKRFGPARRNACPERSLFASLSFKGDAGAPELDNRLNDLCQPPRAHRHACRCRNLLGGDLARRAAEHRAIPSTTKATPNISETNCFLAGTLPMTLDQIEGRCFDLIF